MNPSERLASVRTPVTEETMLQMFTLERLLKQRVVSKIQHAETEVKTCPEVGVHLTNLLRGQAFALDGRASFSIGRDALALT
jgi:hypothetical protein